MLFNSFLFVFFFVAVLLVHLLPLPWWLRKFNLLAVWAHAGDQMRKLLDSYRLSDIASMAAGDEPWPGSD